MAATEQSKILFAALYAREYNKFQEFAKSLPLGGASTIAEWAAVILLFEKAHAYDRESDSHQTQRDAYNVLADAAGEPA